MDEKIGMDRATFEDRYLWNIKVLGQFIGLWPYQEKSKKYFSRGITIFLLLILNCGQIAHVIRNFSIDLLTDEMPFLLLGVGVFVKQFNYIINEKRIRILLNIIVSDFLEERPKEETEILETCINRAIFYGYIYKAAIIAAGVIFLSLPAIPRVLDIVAPLNKSRERMLTYDAYYFVDEQRFYYPILFHMTICTCIMVCIFISCDLSFTHLVQHACALLGISGYRFKHAMDALESLDKNNVFLMEKNYAQVIECIKIHKKANEFVEILDAAHIYYLIIGMGIVMVAFTVNFLKLTTLEVGSVFIMFAMFTLAQVVHVSYISSMAQFLANANDELYETICQAKWYKGSTQTQALYVLVLRKCLFPLKLTAGGVVEVNFACCVQILKASFSYYTVLHST